MIQNLSKGVPAEIFNRATTGSSDSFAVPPNVSAAVFQAQGTDGSITAIVVDLETSIDLGVTFQKLQTGITLTTVPLRVVLTGLAGLLVRLTSTTFTLNTATRIRIVANPT